MKAEIIVTYTEFKSQVYKKKIKKLVLTSV